MINHFMQRALALAKLAEQKGEVPIGAVLVLNNEIIGEGYNQPISSHDPTAHAEIVALRNAAQKIKNYRLVDTELYVTLQPCAMCMGALVHARVKRVVFGASRNIGPDITNHDVVYEQGAMQEECRALLMEFFLRRR